MKLSLYLIIFIACLSLVSCGKKTTLNKLPNSDFPREYSTPDD